MDLQGQKLAVLYIFCSIECGTYRGQGMVPASSEKQTIKKGRDCCILQQSLYDDGLFISFSSCPETAMRQGQLRRRSYQIQRS